MDDALSLAAALRRYRQAAGLSQEALAERSGLSVEAVSAIERGLRRPRAATLRVLGEALGLSAVQTGALLASLRRGGHARTAAALPGLPAVPFSLVGREHDLAVAHYLLDTAGIRLLTLTGAGGVGKTRLALAAAAEAAPAFPDGVTWVDLASLRDHTHVAGQIARQLGVQERGAAPVWPAVLALLRLKRALLVLDNFEHLLDAASLVQALLAACPRLTVLVTSRVALGLRAEHLYVVPPLALPEAQATTPEEVAQAPAVALFLQRARAVQPALQLTASTAPQVAEICRRLDGVPLALELAAALTPVLAPGAMLRQLGDAASFQPSPAPALDLLAAGSWDRPDRQQTMRAAIAWSYDLLSPSEQEVFRCLGVFSGGWDTPGALALVHGDTGAALPSLLDRLVAKHLVHHQDGPGGAPRFGMLETIREYAAEQLEADGALADLRDAHLAHYTTLAVDARDHLTGPDQVVWMARLDADLNNVRAALDWACRRSRAAAGLRLATAMSKFWDRQSYLHEGRGWLERLLALPASADLPERAPAARALGVLAYRQADQRTAATWLVQSADLYRRLGDVAGAVDATAMLANVRVAQGDYDQAIALFEETLASFRAREQQWDIASSLNNLGEVLRAQGDFARADACYQESLALYRRLNDLWSVASVLNNLGEMAYQQGDDARAEALSRESLALNRQLGDRQSIPMIHLNLGNVAARRSDLLAAESHYLESLAAHQRRGHRGAIAACLDGLANVALLSGKPEAAARLLGAATTFRAAGGETLPPADRAVHAQIVSAARAALAPAAFQAAWDAGAGLDIDTILAMYGRA